MSEENGRLLAAIAQLEERLTAKMDAGFKKMERLTEDKLEEMTSEMSGMKKRMKRMESEMKEMKTEMVDMKKEMGEQMVNMKNQIMRNLETGRNETNNGENENPLAGDGKEEISGKTDVSLSSDDLSGWDYDRWCPSDNEDKKATTAIELGARNEIRCGIRWYEGDEIIKRMQAERMSKDEKIPSFWNYDPCCLAKEFVGLDQKTFLVETFTFNICFFHKDILRKISKMLIPMDFLNLSYTCRFLHWRLFTFCTCYGPDEVVLEIHDLKVGNYYNQGEAVTRRYETVPNKTVYTLRLEENDRLSMPRLAKLEGRRSVVARVPSCLRKPFFFDKLFIRIYLPFFTKDDFDRCLPFVMPSREYAHQLLMILFYNNPLKAEKFIDYKAVDGFLQVVKPSWYGAHDHVRGHYDDDIYKRNLKVFENCPYARLMDRVTDIHFDDSAQWENIVLLNRIGLYEDPPVSTIIRTIEEFKYGSANLDYHEYQFRIEESAIAFLEYFYSNYAEVEEYSREYDSGLDELELETVKFVAITTKETGRRHTMKFSNDRYWSEVYVAIGKEDVFAENIKKRWDGKENLEDCRTDPDWYRMETALEPEEGDEDEQETAAGINSI